MAERTHPAIKTIRVALKGDPFKDIMTTARRGFTLVEIMVVVGDPQFYHDHRRRADGELKVEESGKDL